ncbi:MAG: PhzF family isomerase [Rickettsiales bacterium]|nr:PhzF family isomerase [Rickettsiales bacterium]
MKKYNIYQIDSFTKEKFRGNPAGVVSNADGLTEEQMQKIARELNNSETAFIFSSNSSNYDVEVRFFTPTCEVPICGHATIAAHYVRAIELKLDNFVVIQKTGAGNLPVEIIRTNDDYEIVMTQGKIVCEELDEEVKTEILKALNIKNSDYEEKCPIEIISTGNSKVMIAVKSKEALNSLNPDMIALKELSKKITCNGYYVFTFDSGDKEILASGRMFAPAIGINEDPVTGNANGPLGVYLIRNSLVKHDGKYFSFKAEQGEAIGRKGMVEVMVNIENNIVKTVRIKGQAVLVFKSAIEIK